MRSFQLAPMHKICQAFSDPVLEAGHGRRLVFAATVQTTEQWTPGMILKGGFPLPFKVFPLHMDLRFEGEGDLDVKGFQEINHARTALRFLAACLPGVMSMAASAPAGRLP